MTKEINSWDRKVIKAILADRLLNIIEVKELETVQSLFYSTDEYAQIKNLIEQKQYEVILNTEQERNKDFGEYLIIIKFKDHNNKIFFATVYDSDELWQDPQIIDFFPQ